MPASTRCTSLGPSRETHSHVIEHQRRAYPPEQVYEHGGRTKSVHTCRAKTTRHGITSIEYVEPPSPQLKVGGVGRQAAVQGQNVDTSTLGSGGRGARQLRHAGVVVIMPQCLAALGVDTFCPGTVRVTCVMCLFSVAVLACVRAFYICVGACICFEHDAQSDDDVCVYGTTSRPQHHRGTTHGTTQWTTTGQSAGQPPGQPWDDPRHSHGTSPMATTRKGFGAHRRQAQVTSAADAGLYRRVLRLDLTPRSLLSHP